MRSVSVGKNLVADTKTVMATVPTKHEAHWVLLHAYNGTSSAKNFDVWWYDKSQNIEIEIITSFPLAAKEYLQFGGDGKYVVLEEGDEIRVKVEAGAVNSVCVVTLELDNRAQSTQFKDFGF